MDILALGHQHTLIVIRGNKKVIREGSGFVIVTASQKNDRADQYGPPFGFFMSNVPIHITIT